jgi:hypothetical protein
MKKIILWIAICLLWIVLTYFWIFLEKNTYVVDKYSYIHSEGDTISTIIISSKYTDLFQDKLMKTYDVHWLEIQNFFVDNKKIRFAHIFYWKTFVCADWRLIIQYNWEEKEIFSYDKEELEIEPCTFNVEQTTNENIFLIDFCLLGWGGSWECLWIDMYYNILNNTWTEWELFFTGYQDNQMIKLPVSRTDRNWKYTKWAYDEFIEYMKAQEFEICYF